MRIDSMSRGRRVRPSQSHRRWARRALTVGTVGVHITKRTRKYAADQAISEEEALKKGMEESSAARWTIRRIARKGEAKRSQKSKQFVESGAEVYTTA